MWSLVGTGRREKVVSGSGKERRIRRSMALSLAQPTVGLWGTAAAAEPTVSESVKASAMWKKGMGSPWRGVRCYNNGPHIEIEPVLDPSSGKKTVRRRSPPDLVADEEAVRAAGSATRSKLRGVPVYVMLPLDTVRKNDAVMSTSLWAMKTAGVEGVMVDVWWGVVENDGPGEYRWLDYANLFDMVVSFGLKVQAVMSFHRCGGNVGDSCTIPLPRWVAEEMDRNRDMAYTDQWGRRNDEYISLGCDALPVLRGRTPVQCYADFMRDFRRQFRDLLGSTIVDIQVGMGPAGELRYPSYPEEGGAWKFPGIGAFQCFDKNMLSSMRKAAEEEGRPEWCGPPTDGGGYNSWPENTNFFRHDGGWSCPYGEFFLTWYSKKLLDHGETILSSATSIFQEDFDKGVKISVKIAGIHWHFGTRSHAAELTAGYYNTRLRDGYLPIARMLRKHGAVFNFTCVEMKDLEQPGDAQCMPEGLVRQVALATKEAGVELAGENALPRYDESAHDQIVKTSTVMGGQGDGAGRMMCAFTYLRMSPELFEEANWKRFVVFVWRMGNGNGDGAGDCRLPAVALSAHMDFASSARAISK